VDLSSLRQLANEGIAKYLPPTALGSLVEWCWDYGESTGDARYCSISRTLSYIYETFEIHEAVSQSLIDELDELLAANLVDVIEARTAVIGSSLARQLRNEVSLAIANAG
jgi:hypothetical protein